MENEYVSSEVSEKIKRRLKEFGITAEEMLSELGMGKRTLQNYKASMPKADNLAKIADYLDCSVDYLLGRTDNPEVTYNNHALSGDGGVAVAGGNANITISNQQKEDTELLNLIKSLPLKKRVKIISMIYEELEEETK